MIRRAKFDELEERIRRRTPTPDVEEPDVDPQRKTETDQLLKQQRSKVASTVQTSLDRSLSNESQYVLMKPKMAQADLFNIQDALESSQQTLS